MSHWTADLDIHTETPEPDRTLWRRMGIHACDQATDIDEAAEFVGMLGIREALS